MLYLITWTQCISIIICLDKKKKGEGINSKSFAVPFSNFLHYLFELRDILMAQQSTYRRGSGGRHQEFSRDFPRLITEERCFINTYLICPVGYPLQSRKNLLTIGHEVFDYVIFPVVYLLDSRRNQLTIGRHDVFEYVIFLVVYFLDSRKNLLTIGRQDVFEYVIFPVVYLLHSRRNLLTIDHDVFDYVIYTENKMTGK